MKSTHEIFMQFLAKLYDNELIIQHPKSADYRIILHDWLLNQIEDYENETNNSIGN